MREFQNRGWDGHKKEEVKDGPTFEALFFRTDYPCPRFSVLQWSLNGPFILRPMRRNDGTTVFVLKGERWVSVLLGFGTK